MTSFDPQKFIQQREKIKQAPSKTGTDKVIDTAKEKGVGLLKSTIDMLNTFAYGIGGSLSGVSPKEGIKRKILPSQALGITNAVSAMATDILLDPTTYITLGVGGGAKIATKTGAELVLNKAGTTALRETIQRVGAEQGKKEFAEIIAKNPQWLDKGGIKFMGQSIIPQSAIKASINAIKPVGKIIEEMPIVGKGIRATTKFAQEAFDPLYKIKKLPMGEDFIKKFKLLTKSTRSEIVDSTEAIAKEYAGYVKQYGKEFGDDVTKYIESGITKSPEVADIGQKIIKIQDQMAEEEIKRGLLKSTLGETAKFPAKIKPIVDKYADDILSGIIKTSEEFKKILTKEEKKILNGANTPSKVFEKIITTKPNVENYLRHFLTEKGREYIQKGGDFYGALPKPLRARLQSANTRTIRASIPEINEAMKSKVGGNFFEPNAFKALAGRQAEHIRAVNIFDFIEGVKSDYGLRAIKGEKERFVDGIRYIESKSPQLKGVLLPEPIVQHIDDTIKFINGDEATNNFLNGYDKLLRFWKGTVTGYFPAFHTRNMIGGAFNNWLGKVSPKSYAISEDILDFTPKSSKEKALEPIVQEAKKYKSAEEFVKARGTPIYRGGEINNEIAGLGNLGSGVYFTTDAQQALSFSKTKNEKFIEAILPKGEYATRKDILTAEQISLLNKKLKLGLDKEELKSAENFIDFYEGVITPRLEGSKMTQSQLGKIMEEVTGKVGIIDDYYGAKQYLIFNPKRIMTKNQLTDIWNQAQETKNTLENKIYTSKTGEVFTGKQLFDGARKHGAIGQPGMIDVMKEVEKDIGKSKLAKLGDYPVKTMEFVENRIRFPMFVDRVINRGWSMEDAAKDVFKYHFDYAPEGLSAFERNWMKRLIPFYTWSRNNIPLQLEQIAKQPGKYAAIGKIQDIIGGKEGREEMKDLPDWMKEQLNFRIGGDNGLSLWLQLSLPVEDISKLPVNEQGIRSIVSMMSPLIKTPIEIITNKNIYFGSDIVNPELKNYPELQTAKTMNMVKNLPEPLKKFLNVKVIKKKTYVAGKPVWKEQVEMDAKKLYLLKSAFGRFYSTIEQVGGDKENIAQKLLRVLGGIPVREIDLETQRYWDSYNKAKEEKAKRSYEKSRIIE